MVDLLKTLASYVPALVVRRLEKDNLHLRPDAPEEERVTAAMLFADISGFTVLAERLAQRGPEGAEELSDFLNRTFDELITLIIALGGDIVTFAGDALLALWQTSPSDLPMATRRAAQCSLALQELFHHERVATHIHLDVRIGVGVGEVGIAYVGGVYDRWMWVVTGGAVAELMLVEQQAQPGQVVLSAAAWDLVKEYCRGEGVGAARPHPANSPSLPVSGQAESVRLDAVNQPAPISLPMPVALKPAMEAALRSYIPGMVLNRLSAGHYEWLAELRRITVLFISLPILHTPDVPVEHIQTAVHLLQTSLYRYEGSINKISVDEKGAIMIGVYGLPPLSHEDDALRGVQAALAVRESLQTIGWPCSIGVTTGQAFCGVVGNDRRREYTILGDVVNLAARLMQSSTNDILCDGATYQAARWRVAFEKLSPIVAKGKSRPIAVFRPREVVHAPVRLQHALIGRDFERMVLENQLQSLQTRKEEPGQKRKRRYGAASVLIIEGEAGMGKSRLVEDLREQAQAMSIMTLASESDAVEQSTPYYAWRRIFFQLFELDTVSNVGERREHVLKLLTKKPILLHQASLLNAVLPLELPRSDIVAHLTGQAMAEATRNFLVDVLHLFLDDKPSLLILEGARWFDTASWGLVLALSQQFPSLFLVIATRPLTSPPEPYLRLAQSSHTRKITLEALTYEESAVLVCQCLGVAFIPESVAALIYRKAQGNPFYSEELAYALRDGGWIAIEEGECRINPKAGDLHALKLPDTIQGVITSRIDRLTLTQQLTLKVASIIGPTFALSVLRDVYPIEITTYALVEDLAALERIGMIQRDTAREEYLFYRFKHVITYDAVYHLMPHAQRRQMHRALADWYIRTFPDRLDEFASLLALHLDRAGDARAQKFYTLAGNVAFRLYANLEAITHFRHAIRVAYEYEALNEHFLYLYSRLGHILEVEARFDEALGNYYQMADLATRRNSETLRLVAQTALASLYVRPNTVFNPVKGAELLEHNLALARTTNDETAEMRILRAVMVHTIFSGGDPQQAIVAGEQSLLLARKHNYQEQVARTLSDLSMACLHSGELARGRELLEEVWVLWREMGDLPMLADTMSRYALVHFLSGNYEQVIAVSVEAGQISQSIGNAAAQANSQFVAGLVYLEYGQLEQGIEAMKEAIYQGEAGGNLLVQIGLRADLAWAYGTLAAKEQADAVIELARVKTERYHHFLRPWVLAIQARLLVASGDLGGAAALLQQARGDLRNKNGVLLESLHVALAEAELALAQHNETQALAVSDGVITWLNLRHIHAYRPDALFFKARAFVGMEQYAPALSVLNEAHAAAEAIGSQRMMWSILFLLSQVEAQRGFHQEAEYHRERGWQIANEIARKAPEPSIRESFLELVQERDPSLSPTFSSATATR